MEPIYCKNTLRTKQYHGSYQMFLILFFRSPNLIFVYGFHIYLFRTNEKMDRIVKNLLIFSERFEVNLKDMYDK